MTTLLRLPSVIERTGLGRTAIYDRVKAGLLPTPIKQGARVSVWPANEIDACNDAVIRGLSDDERRALVVRMCAERAAAKV
ncbi:helix-turn-helix transcriptional regulator [Ottowia sp.]|uniref:helix-turn-helix transcriptional regulator n=1 Tax=Ottowia sp. TaxID=1898956 RepID=UPI003A895103